MKQSFRMVFVLSIVCAVSALALSMIYQYAQPRIEDNLKKEMEKAIFAIFTGATGFKEERKSGETAYLVEGKNNIPKGYAFLAQGNGYQGPLKILVGIDMDLKHLKGIEILESQETPGLGQEVTKKKFRDQFRSLSVMSPIEYVKNKKPEKPYQIQAITGATISSSAVVNIINKKLEKIKKAFGR